MAKPIFTLGIDLPGDDFEEVPEQSTQTLLDADIVVYMPGFLGAQSSAQQYQGEPILNASSSASLPGTFAHWRSEIGAALLAGKTVVVFLSAPQTRHRYTGQKKTSGTGRSAVDTHFVDSISSYSAISPWIDAAPKSGSGVRLVGPQNELAAYWSEFGAQSPYEALITSPVDRVLLATTALDKPVAGTIKTDTGRMIALPPLRVDEMKGMLRYKQDVQVWTDEALRFGKRLAFALRQIARVATDNRDRSAAPTWTQHAAYALRAEDTLRQSVAVLDQQIAQLTCKMAVAEAGLAEAGWPRSLLFETGKPLEDAVRKALRILEFRAENFVEGDSEFDALFESPEGRFIGEVEGRDSKAIAIEKMSQLQRNLREDFDREEVTAYAKGVLFGNAARLAPPEERAEFFTAKCVTAAARDHIALVRTPDLFPVVAYLLLEPNPEYAASCRRAICDADGAVVVFPAPPTVERSTTQPLPSSDSNVNPSAEPSGLVNEPFPPEPAS
jgi:hypothetical protein